MQRLARACYHHRRSVLAAWVVVLVGLSFAASSFGGVFKVQFGSPRFGEPTRVRHPEGTGFVQRAGAQAQIVFTARTACANPRSSSAMEPFFDDDQRQQVPRHADRRARTTRQRAPDLARRHDRVRRAQLQGPRVGRLPATPPTRSTSSATHVERRRPPRSSSATRSSHKQAFGSEAIGLILAMIILLVAFGSLLAMGLPIATALFGIGCGVAVVQLVANCINMPDFTTQAVLMISIGVGIDYALFIVTRYREALDVGRDPETRSCSRSTPPAARCSSPARPSSSRCSGSWSSTPRRSAASRSAPRSACSLTMLASVTLLPALLGLRRPQHRPLRAPPPQARDGTDRRSGTGGAA